MNTIANNPYSECRLCPRECGISRTDGHTGFCGCTDKIVVNLAKLHFGEEPVISGNSGSGTVFFSGCNLGCIFCQNYEISHINTVSDTGSRQKPKPIGNEVTASELSDIFISLQNQGANNINLVTPMHFAPGIREALLLAKPHLTIPVIVNTGGYDSVSTLKLLDGLVDIYMPDFKFFSLATSNETTRGASNYPDICKAAISEMFRQTGPISLGSDGMLKKGLVVRHLMLPGKLFESRHILDYLTSTYGDDIYISLMNQYTPMPVLEKLSAQGTDVPDYLFRKLNPAHYDSLINYLCDLNQTNAFVQDSDASGTEMIPDFNL